VDHLRDYTVFIGKSQEILKSPTYVLMDFPYHFVSHLIEYQFFLNSEMGKLCHLIFKRHFMEEIVNL